MASEGDSLQRVVAAARELFFSRGFERVSTADLAKGAGVSKATLYKHFSGMDAVLRAVVEAEVDGFEHGLCLVINNQIELQETLTQYGCNLLSFLNQSDIIRFSQLMFEEARSNRDLAATFYECAYGRTQADLASLLQQGLTLGLFESNASAGAMAEQLLGLWEGFGFIQALLGLTMMPFPDPQGISSNGVQTLLYGVTKEG